MLLKVGHAREAVGFSVTCATNFFFSVKQKPSHSIPFCPYLGDRNLHQVVSQQEKLFYTGGLSTLLPALLLQEAA